MVDTTAPAERVSDQIERICEEISELLEALRGKAREMKERGDDGP